MPPMIWVEYGMLPVSTTFDGKMAERRNRNVLAMLRPSVTAVEVVSYRLKKVQARLLLCRLLFCHGINLAGKAFL